MFFDSAPNLRVNPVRTDFDRNLFTAQHYALFAKGNKKLEIDDGQFRVQYVKLIDKVSMNSGRPIRELVYAMEGIQ
jgi:hypothetical protein